jgi:hypothetical protein
MKTLLSNTQTLTEVSRNMPGMTGQNRSKIISAADVWNIQRHKRSFIQRRFSL